MSGGRYGKDTGMASIAELLSDAFGRVREGVEDVLDGIDDKALRWRPHPHANTVGWLVWHLTRIQDDHIAAAFGRTQVWHQGGWVDRFGLPFDADATGYGMGPEDVGRIRASAALLRDYFRAVADTTDRLVETLTDQDLSRVVDERWDPPVTLAVRLVSVIGDDLQHVGQAAYVKGLARSGIT